MEPHSSKPFYAVPVTSLKYSFWNQNLQQRQHSYSDSKSFSVNFISKWTSNLNWNKRFNSNGDSIIISTRVYIKARQIIRMFSNIPNHIPNCILDKSESLLWTEVVNPRHHTSQGETVAKPATPLQIDLLNNVDLIWKWFKLTSPLQYAL